MKNSSRSPIQQIGREGCYFVLRSFDLVAVCLSESGTPVVKHNTSCESESADALCFGVGFESVDYQNLRSSLDYQNLRSVIGSGGKSCAAKTRSLGFHFSDAILDLSCKFVRASDYLWM